MADTNYDHTPDELSFREVADNWDVPLMALDRNLCFVYANRAYLTATKTSWPQIRGAFLFDIFPDVKERQDPVEAKFREVFKGVQTRLEAQLYELAQPDGTVETRVWQAVQDPFRNRQGEVTHMIQRAEDVTAMVELQRQNTFMQNELAHRIRNMFSVIMATSRISGASALHIDTYVDEFNDRLASMSRIYSKLMENDWRGLSLARVLSGEIEAVVGKNSQRYTLSGDDTLLSVKATKDAALIVHELATNARKFGCFAVPGGHLNVTWADRDGVMEIIWRETGVGKVPEPERVGFGTQIFNMFPRVSTERVFTDDGLKITIRTILRPDA